MKTTKLLSLRGFYSVLMLLFFCTKAFALPEYVFKNPVHISGTDLAVGAKYRFSNVKTGVDAIVTIMAFNNVTLNQLDGTGTGFDEAFQPFIYCPKRKKGYVEFKFDFVAHGTNTPVVLTEIPLTAIDIDGEIPDEKVYESDEFQKTGSYYVNYSTVGSSLNIFQNANWYTAINNNAITYDGIDTVQTDVMFSMVYGGVSSFLYRTGADNKSSANTERLRSVYFKKFSYPNGILASNPLMNFSGNAINNRVNLQYLLNEPSIIKTVEIERAASDMNFKPLQQITIKAEETNYQVHDAQMHGTSYYRLKIVQISGAVIYSNVLRFENSNSSKEAFKVYPSVVNDHATVMLQAVNNDIAIVQLFDYSGRVVYTKQIVVQKGTNTFTIDGLGNISSGNYIATVKSGNQLMQQKIMKQ
jgi:hypothetical protein